MAIIGIDMNKNNLLKNNSIVATVMSNIGLNEMAKYENIQIVKTKVGDKYVLEEMLANEYNLGGEQSGHIIFLDHNTTGDGLLTALKLLSVLKKSNKRISELASVMQVFPQVLVNAKACNTKKNNYIQDPIVCNLIKEIEAEFADEGRVLIRPSGTEPLVRVMIEGKDMDYIKLKAVQLASLIEERLV